MLAMAIFVVPAVVSGSSTVYLAPSHDAYVHSGESTTTHNSGDLYVGDENYNEPAVICRSYLMFDLSAIPSGKQINSAKLFLRTWGVGPNPAIVVGSCYLNDDSWNENSITWNNAPTGYGTPSDTQTCNNSATWYNWNVTSAAKTAYQGDLLLSEVLVSNTEGGHQWVGFCASEHYDPQFVTPYLEVTFSDPGIPGILPNFEQIDWVESPFHDTPDSSWGRMTLRFDDIAQGYQYVNLMVNGVWEIQNMSVEASGKPQVISTFFNLGVQNGQDVRLLNYLCTIDDYPLPEGQPPQGTEVEVDVLGVQVQLGSETINDIPIRFDLPELDLTGNFNPVVKSGKLPNLDKFVNQPQGTNQCAPGAISNSLKYLQATGGVDASMPTDISDVGGVIGTTASGTPASWYQKKSTESYFTDHVTTRTIEAPLDAAEIDDLIAQLEDGQDIEMDLVGHVEVLAEIRVRADGSIELDLFDDNQTDNQSDPMHTSTVQNIGGKQYVDGMELERFVVECPKESITVADTIMAYFYLDTWEDWTAALGRGAVRPLTQEEGDAYLMQLQEFTLEGEPYPYDPVTNPFIVSDLFVYEGDEASGGGEIPLEDAGLAMGWGGVSPDGNEWLEGEEHHGTSAWAFKYDDDPDFSNCIISLAVTAPQWSFVNPSSQINKVSFGIGSPATGSGPVRSWSWDCGPGKTIQWNVPTTITIDTSKTGLTAATPTADGYANNPAFNIQNVTWLCVDENGTWIGGANQTAPGPGNFTFLWNYWHWIMVTPRTTVDKGVYEKWSQPPVVLDPDQDPPMILGWDEPSCFNMPIAADDWPCKDDRPITDVHWWGSFFKVDSFTGQTIPWTQPQPPMLPNRFHIGIWTDVPVSADNQYSHPGILVWENYCVNFVWNFAGYDRDPRIWGEDPAGVPNEYGGDDVSDACFQFTQLLSQDEWFYQKPLDDPDNPRIYWLSIAPIWPTGEEPEWRWGWKTRPHFFQDDAVSITQVTPWWPPVVGTTKWVSGIPLQIPPYPDPEGHTWDLAFELTTNEGIPGDINNDGSVGLPDVVILSRNWLTSLSTTP